MGIRITTAAHSWPIDRYEVPVLISLQRVLPGRIPIRVAKTLSLLAEHAAIWIVISGAFIVLDARNRLGWTAVLTGVIAAHLGSSAIKFVVRRARPTDNRVLRYGKTMSQLSFPSSHSANTAAFATGVTLLHPEFLCFGIIVIACMGMGRMVLGVHYLTDVLAGVAWGSGIAWVSHTLIR